MLMELADVQRNGAVWLLWVAEVADWKYDTVFNIY